MIGEHAVVTDIAGDVATVWLSGKWWQARSNGPTLKRWQTVRVVEVRGPTLIVEPVAVEEAEEPRSQV